MDINDILDKAGHHLVVGRAFGSPVEKDGTMIIPVAFVAGGGGGGQGTDDKENNGEGGGFGGIVHPLGVYAIREGQVRFIPAVNVTRIVTAILAVARLAVRNQTKVAAIKGYHPGRCGKAGRKGRRHGTGRVVA